MVVKISFMKKLSPWIWSFSLCLSVAHAQEPLPRHDAAVATEAPAKKPILVFWHSAMQLGRYHQQFLSKEQVQTQEPEKIARHRHLFEMMVEKFDREWQALSEKAKNDPKLQSVYQDTRNGDNHDALMKLADSPDLALAYKKIEVTEAELREVYRGLEKSNPAIFKELTRHGNVTRPFAELSKEQKTTLLGYVRDQKFQSLFVDHLLKTY